MTPAAVATRLWGRARTGIDRFTKSPRLSSGVRSRLPDVTPERADDLRDAARRFGPLLATGVLVVVLLVALFPTRAWLDQRAAIDVAGNRLDALTAENEVLAERVSQLQSDDAIERIAREQYNLVRPGEEAYAILPQPPPEVRADTVLRILDGGVFWR
ncbi:MAG TPA: septum formation initiator family protein [Acidimicrobiales bacterium]|jgi:cell division protein FtsB